jgi:hypothetical protein
MMQPIPPPKQIATYLIQLDLARRSEAVHAVPLLSRAFRACTAWPDGAAQATLLEDAYAKFTSRLLSCEKWVYRVSNNSAGASVQSLAAVDIRMARLSKALAALQATILASSEACCAWAVGRAKTVASEDFGNQLSQAQESITAAKAVGYGGTAAATAVGTLLGGPVGGMLVGGIAALATIGAEQVAKSQAIDKALKNPATVADLAGRSTTKDTAAKRTDTGGAIAGYGGELLSQGSGIASAFGEAAPTLLGPSLGFLGAVLAPFSFLSDVSAATQAPAALAPDKERDAIATAVRLSWQHRTGTTVEPRKCRYLGFASGKYHLMIDGESYQMDPDGVIISHLELVARGALLLAAAVPCDNTALVIDWHSMRFHGRTQIEYCFSFLGSALLNGSPVPVECCIDPDGNWFAGPPNGSTQLLASSTRPSLPTSSVLLDCADAPALEATWQPTQYTLKKLASGKYRLDENQLEFTWLSDAEKTHIRTLVDKHNANPR